MDRETEHETWWRADVEVHNPVTRYRFLLDLGSARHRWLTGEGVVAHDPTDVGDFRLSAHDPPPAWAADAVFYQVFPDRFAPSSRRPELPGWALPAAWDDPVIRHGPASMHQLYGGDLVGLRERLDHLTELGVNAVYATPFFPAESNHRYNAASFAEVDPLLGGDEALVALLARCTSGACASSATSHPTTAAARTRGSGRPRRTRRGWRPGSSPSPATPTTT